MSALGSGHRHQIGGRGVSHPFFRWPVPAKTASSLNKNDFSEAVVQIRKLTLHDALLSRLKIGHVATVFFCAVTNELARHRINGGSIFATHMI